MLLLLALGLIPAGKEHPLLVLYTILATVPRGRMSCDGISSRPFAFSVPCVSAASAWVDPC